MAGKKPQRALSHFRLILWLPAKISHGHAGVGKHHSSDFFFLWNKSHARSDFLSFVGKRKFSSDQLFNGRKRQCIRWTITKIKFSCSLLVQAHDEEVRNVYIFLYFSPQIK